MRGRSPRPLFRCDGFEPDGAAKLLDALHLAVGVIRGLLLRPGLLLGPGLLRGQGVAQLGEGILLAKLVEHAGLRHHGD